MGQHVDISWVHVVGNIKDVVGYMSWVHVVGTCRGEHVVGNNYYVVDDTMYPRHHSICTHDIKNEPTTSKMYPRYQHAPMTCWHIVGTCRGEHFWCRGWHAPTISIVCTHDMSNVPTISMVCTHDIILSPTTSLYYPRHQKCTHDIMMSWVAFWYRGYMSWATFLMSWGTFDIFWRNAPTTSLCTHDINMLSKTSFMSWKNLACSPRHVSHDIKTLPTTSKCYPRHVIQDINTSWVHLIDIVGALMSWVHDWYRG